jgi:hypothetical protein
LMDRYGTHGFVTIMRTLNKQGMPLAPPPSTAQLPDPNVPAPGAY